MIRVVQRIPTDQYAYVELEKEYESAEEAFLDHQKLLKLHQDKVGLPPREWTKVRKSMLEKGECDPNLLDEMSKAQRYWVNETKLAFRSLEQN